MIAVIVIIASIASAESKFYNLAATYSANAWIELKTNPADSYGNVQILMDIGWPMGTPIPLSMYSMKLKARQWTNDLLNSAPPRYYCGLQVKATCKASASACYSLNHTISTVGISLPPSTTFAYVTSRHKWQELSHLSVREDYTSNNGTRSTSNAWKGIHPTSSIKGERGPFC